MATNIKLEVVGFSQSGFKHMKFESHDLPKREMDVQLIWSSYLEFSVQKSFQGTCEMFIKLGPIPDTQLPIIPLHTFILA